MLAAIGSGGPYALAAARALVDLPDWEASAIGKAPAVTSLEMSDFQLEVIWWCLV